MVFEVCSGLTMRLPRAFKSFATGFRVVCTELLCCDYRGTPTSRILTLQRYNIFIAVYERPGRKIIFSASFWHEAFSTAKSFRTVALAAVLQF